VQEVLTEELGHQRVVTGLPSHETEVSLVRGLPGHCPVRGRGPPPAVTGHALPACQGTIASLEKPPLTRGVSGPCPEIMTEETPRTGSARPPPSIVTPETVSGPALPPVRGTVTPWTALTGLAIKMVQTRTPGVLSGHLGHVIGLPVTMTKLLFIPLALEDLCPHAPHPGGDHHFHLLPGSGETDQGLPDHPVHQEDPGLPGRDLSVLVLVSGWPPMAPPSPVYLEELPTGHLTGMGSSLLEVTSLLLRMVMCLR